MGEKERIVAPHAVGMSAQRATTPIKGHTIAALGSGLPPWAMAVTRAIIGQRRLRGIGQGIALGGDRQRG